MSKRRIFTLACIAAFLSLLIILGTGGVQGVHTDQHVLSGEVGTLTVVQPDSETYFTYNFEEEYTDPVVIMKPMRSTGDDPAHIQLRNVSKTGFEYQISEWNSTQGNHPSTKVSYIVLESGEQRLRDQKMVVGETTTDTSFSSIDLTDEFDTKPVVFTQTQTQNRDTDVTTRNRVSADEGNIRLATRLVGSEGDRPDYTDETNVDGNTTTQDGNSKETVGYVAIEQGSNEIDGVPFEVDRTRKEVGGKPVSFEFTQYFESPPKVISDIQTYNSPDTITPKIERIQSEKLSVYIQRDDSVAKDGDISSTESIGYFAIGNGINELTETRSSEFNIISTVVESNTTEGDPVILAVRIENTATVPGEQKISAAIDNISKVEKSVEINAGDTEGIVFELETNRGDAGNHTVNVSTESSQVINSTEILINENDNKPQTEMNNTNMSETGENNTNESMTGGENNNQDNTSGENGSGGGLLPSINLFAIVGSIVIIGVFVGVGVYIKRRREPL